MNRVAVYGGHFDPPTNYHRFVAEHLSERFDSVFIVPCGKRPDLTTTIDSRPIHRAAMADLNFRGIPKVHVELFDLEQLEFTRNWDLGNKYRPTEGYVSHVVEAKYVIPTENGHSRIQNEWFNGDQLWRSAHFTVLVERGSPIDREAFPPNHDILEVPLHIESEHLRGLIFNNDSVANFLCPPVESYLRRHGLFRGTVPTSEMPFRIKDRRFQFFVDPRNPESLRIRDQLRQYESDDPEAIIVAGGDGTMLRAIREHWRKRIPIYGLNTGHLGFLLNDRNKLQFWEEELVLYQLPLLWVETIGFEGERKEGYAFNDTWVERNTGQTAWIEMKINGQVRMSKVVGDGMLVSTAAGSTSYARAMGASPVPFNTPVLLLVGSNVLTPSYWRPAILPLESVIEFTTLDAKKRPLVAFIDGDSKGLVRTVKVRVSNIAAVEIAFMRSTDPSTKLATLQF
jgi:NAD kinase/nicotinic acid mononucleotide adenylyltransferase